MNTSNPAVAANPLHLYDLTHGQRRLTVWHERGRDGHMALHAVLAVPVTMQAPGEAPETEWIIVATARSCQPRLLQCRRDADNYLAPIAGPRLVLDGAEFALLESEAEPLAEYLASGRGEASA
jgi:hypothetical protein